jgi:hypothetical protein
VFVADQAPRAQRFSGVGGYVSSVGVDGSVYGLLGAVGVDSSPGGGVYVAALSQRALDPGAPVVVKYDASGTVSHELSVSGSTTSINYGPVAVDPSDGTVYVSAFDAVAGVQVIDSFDRATGAFIASFDGANGSPDGGFGVCAPSGLAVDGSHRVYVLDPCKGTAGTGRVDEYSGAGVFGATVDDGVSRGVPQAVATDPVSGEVYVAEQGPSGLQVTHYTAGGVSPVQTFSTSTVGALSGMAVGPDGTVYLGDNSANAVVARFTAFEGPTVITGPGSGIGMTSVTLNGTVDPGGVGAHYRYEYGLDTSYGSSTPDGDAGGGSGAISAPATISGLEPNTTYHYRIVGFNASGSIVGEDASLTTLGAPPVVDGLPFVSAITPTTVRVHGTVNPKHTPTHFHIDYGTTTAYGSVSADVDAGASSVDTPVLATLTGLVPGTLYHYRLNADNSAGSQQGADGTFITAPAAVAGAVDTTAAKATLTATIDAHGVASSYHFEYGTTTSYGLSTPEQAAGTGSGEQSVTQAISGLLPSRSYHVRVVTTSSGGGVVRSGADGTFSTAPGPDAVIGSPVGVTLSTTGRDGSVTLVGSADVHGLAGSYRFELASLSSDYAILTPEQPLPNAGGVQQVSAAVSGLPLDEGFRARLIVFSNDASDYSDQVTFATPPLPRVFAPPPPPEQVYGCTTPRLDGYDHQPKPGQTVQITGSGLGVGGNAVLGDQTLNPTNWTQTGFSLQIPANAKGTQALTINCGHGSNTIAIAIYHQPDNTFTITSHTTTTSNNTIKLAIKVPGPGKIQTASPHTTPTNTTITKKSTTTISIPLTRAAIKSLNHTKTGKLKTTIRVRYTPAGGQPKTKTITTTNPKTHR